MFLKVREDIDLKELKKYGFTWSTASFENRHSEIEEVVENLLYDLTKANLLEKIRKEERHDDK